MRRPFVADGTVRYVGQPVVAVIAEDRYQAADAAELVVVDYDPLPVVVDPEASTARRGAAVPRCRDERRAAVAREAGGRLQRVRGHRGRADRQPAADRSADRAALGRRLLDRRRPPRALLGVPGRAPDQGPARRRSTASIPRQVRVVVPDVGGGFGAKSRTYPEELAIGFYARAGRPPGEVDRDPLGEHGGDAPRARARCNAPSSAAPATGASPPTTSTWSATPGRSRSSARCCR